jgi:A/G-specific adenine glycosylase
MTAALLTSISAFRRSLLAWYDGNKRALPWRQSRDPYHVWLSEIMLQQTRVAAVLEHYRNFLRKFPSVQELAAARPSSVLAAWSGLGYYRRARLVHAAARQIVKVHGGRFPSSVAQLRSLPGVGRYTAAAIASIAFDQPAAVVDGNVERILQRLAGQRLGSALLWERARALLSRRRPGDFNQAMMELGATVCLPRSPKCLLCPVSSFCSTRGALPVPLSIARRQRRTIQYALSRRGPTVLLSQRGRLESHMPGMWELPEIALEMARENGSTCPLFTLRHSITNTDYCVRVVELSAPGYAEGVWVAQDRLAGLPLTGLARKILRRAGII